MFIKSEEKKEIKNTTTDVIAKDKKLIKYKSLLRIIESIHILFFPKAKEEQTSNNS
ncbi:hypothetical protein J6O48_08040 [bacterium]|nr:hypothetical protein [bacterium]